MRDNPSSKVGADVIFNRGTLWGHVEVKDATNRDRAVNVCEQSSKTWLHVRFFLYLPTACFLVRCGGRRFWLLRLRQRNASRAMRLLRTQPPRICTLLKITDKRPWTVPQASRIAEKAPWCKWHHVDAEAEWNRAGHQPSTKLMRATIKNLNLHCAPLMDF